jgi:3',5'-cyclic AMP phosphodiesterase CpdA
MESFRLVQLSDLHIAVRPYVESLPDWWQHGWQFPRGTLGLFSASSHDPDILDAAVRAVYERRQDLDAVLLTGDLATTGSMNDLVMARAHVEVPAISLHRSAARLATLASSGLPVILLPGNHDRYRNRAFGAGGRNFEQVFASWNAPRGVQSTVLQLGNERLALVCADFCLANDLDASSIFGRLGQGFAYDSILVALEQETRSYRSQGVGVIWVIHFPPLYPGISRDLALLNEAALIARANTCGVLHILAGHTHRSLLYPPAPGPAIEVFCAGTACQYVAPGGNVIHLLDVTVDAGRVSVSRADLRWNQARGAFV